MIAGGPCRRGAGAAGARLRLRPAADVRHRLPTGLRSTWRGEMTLAEVASKMKTETHRLARMQATWFRRDDPRIHWLDVSAGDPFEEAAAHDLKNRGYDFSHSRE